MSQPATDETTNIPVPPANFLFLVESILMQVQMQLGLLNFGGDDEKPEPELNLARHSIDMLAMLQEKTRGNLTLEEQRLLENGLTEMRFRYVQVADGLKKQNSSPAASTASPGQTASADSAAKPLADDQPRIIIPDGGKGSKSV